jgi:hypothetical protein
MGAGHGKLSKTIDVIRLPMPPLPSALFQVVRSLFARLAGYVINRQLITAMKKILDTSPAVTAADWVLAVTFEEAIALAQSAVPYKRRCLLLLELPRTGRLRRRRKSLVPFLRKFQCVFALDDVFQLLTPDERTATTVYSMRHPTLNRPTRLSSPPCPGFPIRILYGGGLDRYQRNPIPVLPLIRQLADNQSARIDFYSYGNLNAKLRKLTATWPYFFLHNSVSPDKFLEIAQDAQVLLSFGNRDADLSPSKIFQLMATGHPIIHFYQNRDDICLKVLAHYPFAICVPLNYTSNLYAAREITNFLQRAELHRLSFSEVASLFPNNTPYAVATQLSDRLISLKVSI